MWPRRPACPPRTARSSRRWALALALVLAGCQQVPLGGGNADDMTVSKEQREDSMNRRWQLHSMSELVRTLGPPALMLDIPGGGNPPGYALVYGQHAGTGCLDTFAVATGPADPIVRSYFCR